MLLYFQKEKITTKGENHHKSSIYFVENKILAFFMGEFFCGFRILGVYAGILGVRFNKIAARCDVVAHEHGKNSVGFGGAFYAYLP